MWFFQYIKSVRGELFNSFISTQRRVDVIINNDVVGDYKRSTIVTTTKTSYTFASFTTTHL